VLVQFSRALSDEANRAALAAAAALGADPPPGTSEIVPSLVSVLVTYDPAATDPSALSAQIALRLSAKINFEPTTTASHAIQVTFDGEDLPGVAQSLGLSPAQFIERHNGSSLRVLATGFAPGFVYCGFHPQGLRLPRRQQVRALVPVGTVLFAAGQTAIAATPIPTGWHVIGHTDLRNFDPAREPPTRLAAGDTVIFRNAP